MVDSRVHVSVVIPCYNAAGVLGGQLVALQRQIASFKWEIIVADNGSTDATAFTAAQYSTQSLPVVVCDASAHRGVNHARNVGVRNSRGDFILLCDADDQVTDGWLAAMSEAFTSGASLVGGRLMRVTPDRRPVGVADDGLRKDLSYLPWPQGANCGFSRPVYDELGGFDEGYTRGGDETDFFWRAQLRGYTLEYVRAAAILYTEKPVSKQRFWQYYYYGRSHVQLFKAFAAAGMPRGSIWSVLRAWLEILRILVAGVRSGDRRRIAIQHLGQRVGRIGGSAAFRVWYL
ncbi:MAG TPA: glycosyltransferase family 2 protein [Solirubrobacteraceae bacterium]|nr:glycosyltransferase family 2 protein [Solirubrobacteraceae bacterium]